MMYFGFRKQSPAGGEMKRKEGMKKQLYILWGDHNGLFCTSKRFAARALGKH